MEWFHSSEAWIALATLTVLEIVLGVDNIIFISILVGRLPRSQRNKGRILGLAFAMLIRILLLLSITWVMKLTRPLFSVFSSEISWRDLILIIGGLFLLAKSTHEIHLSLEAVPEHKKTPKVSGILSVAIQVGILDIIFSLDSVITAVGLARHVEVMIIAIVLAIGVMMFAAGVIGEFVDKHPTIKMLALSFLILIGFVLIGEGFGVHVPKGYIYFAMAFSTGVELLNLRVRKRQLSPVKLHKPRAEES